MDKENHPNKTTFVENEKAIDNNTNIYEKLDNFFKNIRDTFNIQENSYKVADVENISDPMKNQ